MAEHQSAGDVGVEPNNIIMDGQGIVHAETEDSKVSFFPLHITIQRGLSLPSFQKCSCCSPALYHCPFCTPEFLKPTKLSKLKLHLNKHMKRAVPYEEYTIHRCGLGCRKQQHFHCLYCLATILRKRDLKIHLSACLRKHSQTLSKPPQGSSSVIPAPDSSPASPAGPVQVPSVTMHIQVPSPTPPSQTVENRKMDLQTILDFLNSSAGVAGSGPSAGPQTVVSATHRQCSIELTNDTTSYTLCNPRVYLDSGCCSIPLPPTIRPSSSGSAVFIKTPTTARGSVGIFTYDLFNNFTKSSSEKAAVLFVVPLNLTSIVYAVGVFDGSKECDRHLFREMSKAANANFVRGKAKGPSLTHHSQHVTVMATMSNCSAAVMKVEISEN